MFSYLQGVQHGSSAYLKIVSLSKFSILKIIIDLNIIPARQLWLSRNHYGVHAHFELCEDIATDPQGYIHVCYDVHRKISPTCTGVLDLRTGRTTLNQYIKYHCPKSGFLIGVINFLYKTEFNNPYTHLHSF